MSYGRYKLYVQEKKYKSKRSGETVYRVVRLTFPTDLVEKYGLTDDWESEIVSEKAEGGELTLTLVLHPPARKTR